MPIDPNIPLDAGRPSGPFGPNYAQVFAAQNQSYRNYLQGQDIIGQNALQALVQNQNNLNPNTGLPTTQAIGQLMGVAPQQAFEMLGITQKLQESQARTNLANFGLLQQYNSTYDKNVAGPVLEYKQQLQSQGIPPEQQQSLLNQKNKELTDNWQKSNAIPDNVRAAMDRPPDDTLQFRSESFRKQQAEIAKGWSQPLVDNATGAVVYRNPFLGPGLFNRDNMTLYEPKGTVVETGKGAEPQQWVDIKPDGTRVPILRNPLSGTYTDADNKPYTPTNPYEVGKEPKQTGGAKIKAASPLLSAEVKQADGSYKSEMVRQQERADGTVITTNEKGEEIPKDNYRNIKPASTATTEMSPEATAYMAERERLGLHMTAAWATSKYLPQMAERDIKSSLGLPEDAKITTDDARAAAMNDVVTQRGMRAEASALQNIAKLNSNIGNFEGTALRNANLVEQLGPKGVAGGDMLWNRFRNASRRNIEIDPDLTKLDNAITDFKNEYVRIMSTAAGTGTMTSDAAREEGNRLFNSNQPWEVMQGALATARQTMRNRVDSVRGQYNATLDSIRGKGVFAEQPPLRPEEGREPDLGGVSGKQGTAAPAELTYDSVDAAKADIKPGQAKLITDENGKTAKWFRPRGGGPVVEIPQR